VNTTTYLRSRVDGRPLAAALAAGDVLALTAFIAVGTAHHGEQPLSSPGVVAGALAPFLLSWTLVALAAGLYTAGAVRSVRRTLVVTVPAWTVAVLVGQGLRATSLFEGGTSVAFVLVTVGVGGLAVIGWRVLATVLVGKTAA